MGEDYSRQGVSDWYGLRYCGMFYYRQVTWKDFVLIMAGLFLKTSTSLRITIFNYHCKSLAFFRTLTNSVNLFLVSVRVVPGT